MSYLYQYDQPGVRIENIKEINGYSYVLGWEYNNNQTPKVNLYVSKIDSSGNQVWQKRFKYPDAVNSGSVKIHFEDITEASSKELLLLAYDDVQALILKIDDDGNLIWVKKYYDKNNTQLYYNRLSFRPRLHTLSEEYSILVVQDIHSYNGGVRRLDYRFIKFQNDNGNVVDNKILETTNPKIIIRDQQSFKETIVLAGSDGKNICIFYVDINLRLSNTYKFKLGNTNSERNYLHLFRLSSIKEGKFSAMGGYWSDQGNYIFVMNFDFYGLKATNSINISDKPWSQIAQDIENVSDDHLIYYRGNLHSLSNSLNLNWTRKVEIAAINKRLTPINLNENYIYSYYSYPYQRGYYIISNSGTDYKTCETVEVEDNFNFERYELITSTNRLELNAFNSIEYPQPQISLQTINIPSSTEICKYPTKQPEIDLKQSTIRVKNDCLLPGRMQSLIYLTLRDTEGNVLGSGGDNVSFTTNLGQLGAVTDYGNGVYSVSFSSNSSGVATIKAFLEGKELPASVQIRVSKECFDQEVDIKLCTIQASNKCLRRKEKSIITIRLYDSSGNAIINGEDQVEVFTSLGTISSIQDNGDGTYTCELLSAYEGIATVYFTVNGKESVQTIDITISKQCGSTKPNADNSTITASPNCIHPKEGQSLITIQLYDDNGNPVLNGGANVAINNTAGNISNVTDQGDGSYTAILTATGGSGTFVSFSVDGDSSQNYIWINFSTSCNISGGDLTNSQIKTSSNCIVPDGETPTEVTVYLLDNSGNPLLVGGDNVEIHTTLGNITNTIDNNDGTYTAYLTSNQSGIATLTFLLNGSQAISYRTVVFSKSCGVGINLELSTIQALPSCINANGEQQSTITVQLVDTNGNLVVTGGQNVIIHTSLGNISLTTDNGNGTYSALLSSTTTGTATLSFSILGESGAQHAQVQIKESCEADPLNEVDLEKSTIQIIPNTVVANGQDQATIKIVLRDQNGNPVNLLPNNFSNYLVSIHKINNFGAVNPNNAVFESTTGSYISYIKSSNIGQAQIGFYVNGMQASASATVQFVKNDDGGGSDEGTKISNTSVTWLQSPNFYLQAAGSQGNDSTKGIHLRWVLRGVLGELHLPKRNYATNQYNFNKPNDVIKLYRTRYRKYTFIVNFQETAPTVVDSTNHLWIYRYEQRDIYIHFRNTTKYDNVRNNINPIEDHVSFLQNYGSELIEIETKDELFFKVTLKVNEELANNGSVQAETLSVSKNVPLANKTVSARQTFTGISEISKMGFTCENGIGVRYKAYNCMLTSIEFEFYSDFLTQVNSQSDWWFLGDYALSKNDQTVFNALEPNSGDVNANWLRFNDNEHVNVENYKKQWNGISEPGDRNIKEVVSKYIDLSDNQNNPIANESIALDGTGQDTTQISNLDLLNMAAYDFHIARMLGLGSLDIDAEVFTDQYIYVTEYVTFGNLQDGEGAREVQHLSMSLPTGISDERLPIPIDLKNIVPGVFYGYENAQPINLTDENGYTFDGKTRYVSLFTEEIPEILPNLPFYNSYQEFSAHLYTLPIYGGLEYKMDNETTWRKPELSNTDEYQNVLGNGSLGANETIPLLLPELGKPFYVDNHTIKGWYRYKSYAINWFYRASQSEIQKSIYSDIKPNNSLIAPTNVRAVLVQPESPLLLTSGKEQEMLATLKANTSIEDKTLVRLTYDYHAFHEIIKYSLPNDLTISNQDYENDPTSIFTDDDEVFAERAEIYFRNQVPNNIRGKITAVNNDSSNPLLAILQTAPYNLSSQGNNEQLVPLINSSQVSNYIGGVINIDENSYIIQSIDTSATYPKFKVYKTQVTDAITGEIPSSTINPEELELPVITNDGLFMAVENMQNASSWGNSNPLATKILIGDNWPVHREVIEENNADGTVQRKLEKTRGIWSKADENHTTIEKVLEPQEVLDANGNLQYDTNGNLITEQVHKGLYKITFHGIQLDHHPQHTTSIGQTSVDWDKGIARVFTESSLDSSNTPIKSRKTLKVGKIENIGEAEDLVIYVDDPDTVAVPAQDLDPIPTGTNISVNFYPSYKVYLYEHTSVGLNEELIPTSKDVDYSIFGVRSEDTNYNYFSPVSTPGLMMAQRIVLPEPPQQPLGSDYATRPDYFGRSTYTFTTEYNHQPYGVLFYRSNDEVLLNSIYSKATVQQIRTTLKDLGGPEEPFFTDRWKNFVDFSTIKTDGDFKEFDENGISQGSGYKFPNPDKQEFFDWANQILQNLNQPLITESPGQLAVGDPKIVEFFKGAIYNAFVPLTPLPIIYEHIEGASYQPKDEKQNIKDENGYALAPNHPDFKMAPMMKKVGNYKTQFTDFKLDGTSSNYYFYGVKEMGSQMKIGQFSPFLGPIKLVNTNAPKSPEVKSIKPVLANELTGTAPSVKISINSYPKVQNIKKVKLFRSHTKIEAQSIRTMKLVATSVLDEISNNEEVWTIADTFNDLPQVPYGDALYYRVIVEREVKYADKNAVVITEFAPSQASKILASLIVENKKPVSPVLEYYSTPPNNQHIISYVTLTWNATCYKGKYHVYKMNSQGNWTKIHTVPRTTEETIYLNLEDTDLQDSSLLIKNEGSPIYHHFKVIAENTSGMLSTEENILTIHQIDNWKDIGGIGDMISEITFRIR